MEHNARHIAIDMLLGALAGVAATWVMKETTSYLYKHENPDAKAQEQEARRHQIAYDAAANQATGIVEQGGVSGLSSGASIAVQRAAGLVGKELSEEERKKLELTVGYGLSMAVGAAYALLRRRDPGADWGHGLVFGLALWLLIDEVGNTALGLTPPPGKYPWPAHRRGLVGHLVLGLVTETVIELADEIA